MIRRWSYVNKINLTSFRPYKTFQCFSNDIIFKETTVFRKLRLQYSIVRRKAWGRRRHLYQWGLYLRVLFDWSNDYHFFKHYTSFIMKRSLHKNSFLTYNILFHFSKSSGFYAGLELLNSITICRQTLFYSFRRVGNLPNLYLFFKSSPYMFLTTNKTNLTFLQRNPLLTPILLHTQKNHLVQNKTTGFQDQQLLSLTHSISFQGVLNQLIELYKVIIQLYLYRLFTN